MSNHRYNTPEEGTLDWHIPLNENFENLDRDVEIRDVEANRDEYSPAIGAKFLATDSGATYTGDGSAWNLVGYVSRAVGGDLGHFVRYEAGLEDEAINRFVFGADEILDVTRVSFPVKGLADDETDPEVQLRIYEGDSTGSLLLSLDGNEFTSAAGSVSTPWTATSSPVTVTISNSRDSSVEVVPKVWANIRRE